MSPPCLPDWLWRTPQKCWMACLSLRVIFAIKSDMRPSAKDVHQCAAKQACGFARNSVLGECQVGGVDFKADAVPAALGRGEAGGAGSQERIEHRVADKGEHADQAGRQFQRIRRGMMPGR